MKLLPILWAEPPAAEDWGRLSEARASIGYTDRIQPAEALPGSPQPVLAVGVRPSWITDYTFVEDLTDLEQLGHALQYCLAEPHEPPGEDIARVLSGWMGVEVKFLNEEEYDNGVRFE